MSSIPSRVGPKDERVVQLANTLPKDSIVSVAFLSPSFTHSTHSLTPTAIGVNETSISHIACDMSVLDSFRVLRIRG